MLIPERGMPINVPMVAKMFTNGASLLHRSRCQGVEAVGDMMRTGMH